MSSSDLANMILPTVEWLEYCNRQLFSTESDLLQGDVIFTIQPSTLEGEPSKYFYYGTNGEVICTASTDVLVGSSGIDSVSVPELISTYDSVAGAAITATGTAPENIPILKRKRKKDSSYFTFTRWVGSSPSLTMLTTGTVTAPNIEQLESEVKLLFEGEWMLGLAFFSEPDAIQYHQGTASDFIAIANLSSDFFSHSLETNGEGIGVYNFTKASLTRGKSTETESLIKIEFPFLRLTVPDNINGDLIFSDLFLYRSSTNLIAYSAHFTQPILLSGMAPESVSNSLNLEGLKLSLVYTWEDIIVI